MERDCWKNRPRGFMPVIGPMGAPYLYPFLVGMSEISTRLDLGYLSCRPFVDSRVRYILLGANVQDQRNCIWSEKHSLPILDEHPLLRCGGSVETVSNKGQHEAPEQDVRGVGDAQPG